MSEITKGPWYVGTPDDDDDLEIRTHADKGETLIASVHDTDEGSEWDANARLIAASPIMLEALIEIDNLLKGQSPSTSEAKNIARHAITKATGKEVTTATETE